MTTIDTLAAALEAAKQKIADAQAEYDTALVEWLLHAPTKSEGAVQSVGDGYRITTTYGVNRAVDQAALSALADRIPTPLLLQAVRYKPEPIAAGIRYLRNNEPETYAVLAEALTVTPGKPQVRVEFVGAMKEAA